MDLIDTFDKEQQQQLNKLQRAIIPQEIAIVEDVIEQINQINLTQSTHQEDEEEKEKHE
ncbi:hypothetical protein I4U23_022159 [Adineta vaga]|nr:hypothetical protein I4U23_022159 [Adineta vaga]